MNAIMANYRKAMFIGSDIVLIKYDIKHNCYQVHPHFNPYFDILRLILFPTKIIQWNLYKADTIGLKKVSAL